MKTLIIIIIVISTVTLIIKNENNTTRRRNEKRHKKFNEKPSFPVSIFQSYIEGVPPPFRLPVSKIKAPIFFTQVISNNIYLSVNHYLGYLFFTKQPFRSFSLPFSLSLFCTFFVLLFPPLFPSSQPSCTSKTNEKR